MARFRHPLKLKDVTKEELERLMNLYNSQYKVAEVLGVKQMTVSRRLKALGIKYNGVAKANRSEQKRREHSEKLKKMFSDGVLTPVWAGKKRPKEAIEKAAAKIRGRPSWNSGMSKKYILKCESCGEQFEASKKNRKVCSQKCKGVYFKNLYSDGRYNGDKNPNFGNDKVKEAWENGCYLERPLPKHGKGIGGYHNGIWMRSSWELEFAKNLDDNNIKWKYESKRFKLSNGKTYTPDFYICHLNLWVEIKGYWHEKAKIKFNMFLSEYPEEKIIVISEKPLWNPILNG